MKNFTVQPTSVLRKQAREYLIVANFDLLGQNFSLETQWKITTNYVRGYQLIFVYLFISLCVFRDGESSGLAKIFFGAPLNPRKPLKLNDPSVHPKATLWLWRAERPSGKERIVARKGWERGREKRNREGISKTKLTFLAANYRRFPQ